MLAKNYGVFSAPAMVALLFIIAKFYAGSDAAPAIDNQFIDRMFVTGLHVSVSSRNVTYELSNDVTVKGSQAAVPMVTIELGKRFPLFLPRLRIYTPLYIDLGSVSENSPEQISLDNGTSEELVVTRLYRNVAFAPQLQYRFPVVERKSYLYLSVGGGVNYTGFSENEYTTDNRIRINDPYLDSGLRFSGSFDCGTGLDILINKRKALSIEYGFKIWHPVDYKMYRDLFPVQPIRYRESLFTHRIGLQFMLR